MNRRRRLWAGLIARFAGLQHAVAQRQSRRARLVQYRTAIKKRKAKARFQAAIRAFR